MNVLPHLQVRIKISQTTTLSLATAGIAGSRFANHSEARNQAPTFRIVEQIGLNRSENLDSIGLGEFMKPPGKCERFNEYHSVIVAQSGRLRLGRRTSESTCPEIQLISQGAVQFETDLIYLWGFIGDCRRAGI